MGIHLIGPFDIQVSGMWNVVILSDDLQIIVIRDDVPDGWHCFILIGNRITVGKCLAGI